MNYFEAFDSIKKEFEGAKTDVLTGGFAIQVNLTDEDCGGAFYIEFKDGALSVEPYDYIDNTAMVTADFASFKKALANKTTYTKFVKAGKVVVEGNGKDFEAVIDAVKKPAKPKKAPAKKAVKEEKPVKETKTVKKAEPKKETNKAPVKEVKAAKETKAKKPAVKKTTKK